jgi:DNA-binding NtrC family response regulator
MPRIILIDDDARFISVVAEALRPYAKLHVDTARSAEQGLRLIANLDYDVIASDFRMPGLNGLDLLQECKQLRPTTPVILLTGYGNAPLRDDAYRLGAYAILHKPIDVDAFYVTLLSAARRYDLIRRGGGAAPTVGR